MPARKSITVPYEVRPLTPADIAPTGQLANAYRYGTTDQDINPYPILYPELRKLQQAGKKLITITVRRQLNPLFFLEDFDNLQGVTWNYEDKTVTIPVRTLTQFVGGGLKRDSVPETRVFLMGGTRFNMATTHKTTFYGWCFFRGDGITPEGRFEHVYLDGTMTLPSPVQYFYKVTIISEAPSDLRGLYEVDRVTIKGTASITGKVSLWRYILGGNIAIDCELTRTDAELFGADSAVTTEGSPLVFSESLYPLDEDGYTAADPYGTVRMAWNMQGIYNRVDELHTFTDGITRYCRNPEQHDNTCKCIGWELARIDAPELYDKYVKMHTPGNTEEVNLKEINQAWGKLLAANQPDSLWQYPPRR